MTDFRKRLILKPQVSVSDVEFVAWERDWNISETNLEQAGALVDVWMTDDGRSEIRYVADRPIGLNYLTVHGEDADDLEEQLRTDLDVWTLPEALDALRRATGSKEKALSLLTVALAAPGREEVSVLDEIRTLATDPDPVVRRSLIEATGYLPWPALVHLTEELSRDDPDPAVRQDAQTLLEGLSLPGRS